MNQVKAAHANRQQKAVGYLNAAHEGLLAALWWLREDDPHHGEVAQLLKITDIIRTQLTEEYDQQGEQ